MTEARAPKVLRILPLGDSITYGDGGTDAGYRAFLAELLTDASVAFQFVGTSTANPGSLSADQVHHEGHPGWLIAGDGTGRDGLLEHVPWWLGPRGVRPDMVLLMIGTNDVAMDYRLDTAGERLARLLTAIAQLVPGVRILVAQLTPIADEAADARVRAFNEVVSAVAREQREAGRDVRVVDLHAALTGRDLRDALHPNDTGYEKIARAWADAILAP